MSPVSLCIPWRLLYQGEARVDEPVTRRKWCHTLRDVAVRHIYCVDKCRPHETKGNSLGLWVSSAGSDYLDFSLHYMISNMHVSTVENVAMSGTLSSAILGAGMWFMLSQQYSIIWQYLWPCAYLSSLPILAVVYRFFYLPTANLPIYHNLPISTDFFEDLPNFNFFYRSFCYFM